MYENVIFQREYDFIALVEWLDPQGRRYSFALDRHGQFWCRYQGPPPGWWMEVPAKRVPSAVRKKLLEKARR